MHAVTNLLSGIVIDKSVFQRFSASEATQVLGDAYATGLPVVMVDSAATFFREDNMIKLLEAGDASWILIAQKFNVHLDSGDVTKLSEAFGIRKRISAAISEAIKAAAPLYEFSIIPPSWSIQTHVTIGKQNIRRVTGTGNSNYGIGINTLREIWGWVAPKWHEDNMLKGGRYKNVRAAGYGNSCECYSSHVKVGCQEIQRYEIEQIALHLGWEFPK